LDDLFGFADMTELSCRNCFLTHFSSAPDACFYTLAFPGLVEVPFALQGILQ